MNLSKTKMKPINIGSQRELMIDDYLLEQFLGNVKLQLHQPIPREIVFPNRPEPVIHEKGSGLRAGHVYMTVFQDDDRYRMYYAVSRSPEGLKGPRTRLYHYAESQDGIQWETPRLGLFEYEGSTDNNIIWSEHRPDAFDAHSFSPFRDDNPRCPSEHRYKAIACTRKDGRRGLCTLSSPDAIHWSRLSPDFVITDGAFDSQNLAFWDSASGIYRAYWRDFFTGLEGCRFRGIKTATSEDFSHWSKAEWLHYPGSFPEQLYTNQIIPYFRAPHILVGLPTRYVARPDSEAIDGLPEPERRRSVMEKTGMPRIGTDLTDTLFMSSRNGVDFKRWGEAFIRPGLRHRDSWFYGDIYANWGIVTTASPMEGAPDELSFYVSEGNRREHNSKVFRRYTLRMDGFVSVNASRQGGDVITCPVTFAGDNLTINFSASAAGGVRVELQDIQGVPIPGLTLEDNVESLGDDLERKVRWKGKRDLGALKDIPVRLRFQLVDADLYAFQLKKENK